MPAYNTVTVRLTCGRCGQVTDRRVRFRYGDTWQHEYTRGDELRWGGNDVGVRSAARVRVAGSLEACPACSAEGSEVAILVEHDVLRSVTSTPDLPSPMTGDERFEIEDA